MKIIFFVICLYVIVSASVVDDYYTYKAQHYYTKGDLKNSFTYYEKIERKLDEVYYNMGNILYQTQNYKEAIILYEKITSKKLLEKKWYNLANSYVQIEQYSKAVYYYQKLLQKQDDNDAKENLILVQNQIKKEYLQLLKEQENLSKAKREGKEYEDLFEDSETESTEMMDEKDSNIGSKENISNLLYQNQKEKIYFKELPQLIELQTVQNTNEEKFMVMEERRWDNLLKEKKIDSLIIPLNKKEVLDEDVKYPW